MKKLLIILFIVILSGCKQEVITTPVSLDIYVVDGCGYCDTFKDEAVDYLKKNFSDLQINYYNLDEKEDLERYDEMIAKIKDFDESEYKSTPTIVFEPYFLVVGYEKQEEIALKQDIIHALNHEAYGDTLKDYRWEFKVNE